MFNIILKKVKINFKSKNKIINKNKINHSIKDNFNVYKLLIFFLKIIFLINIKFLLTENIIILNKIYLNIQKHIKINFHNKIYKKIRIGTNAYSLKNGGVERQIASLLNHLSTIGLFKLFLFTLKNKEKNEYKIPKKIRRIILKKNNLIKTIVLNKIDIFIYNFCWNYYEMKLLNNQKNFKVIFYNHESIFLWIYKKFHKIVKHYELLQKSKYIISLVPFENDYLFKKWGINSILIFLFKYIYKIKNNFFKRYHFNE